MNKGCWIGVGLALLGNMGYAMAAGAADGLPPPLPSIPAMGASAAAGVVPVPASLPALAPLSSHGGRRGAFDLRFANVGQVIDLVYADALHVPHVISNDVLSDTRVVSFQFDSSKGDLRAFMATFLDSLGFKVETRDGVDFVSRKGVDPVKAEVLEPFVYRPKHRSAAYLARLVQPLFSRVSVGADAAASMGAPEASLASQGSSAASGMSGAFAAAAGASVPVASPVASTQQSAAVGADDELVVFGKHSDMVNVRKVVEALDTAPGQVVVRGWVYEVSLTDGTNSAWSLAAHVLDGQLGIGAGSVGADSSAFSFDSHFLNAAISVLSSDSRFREVSDPHVRVVSGQKVSLNVGSQVPTIGSVSYQGSAGTAVQSVEYQSAGVLFSVQPVVMGDSVDVAIDEEISSFVATTSGVNGSPTKNTRSLSTNVTMHDGEVVVLGGLVQDTDSDARSGQRWLPAFLDGRSSSKGRTEVLLVLQVEKV